MSYNHFDHSLEGVITPRFRLKVKAEKEDVFEHLQSMASSQKDFGITKANQYLMIKYKKSHEEYWSPELQIQPQQDFTDKNTLILRCVIGPRQNVWVMFVFIYSSIILLTLFGGMFGLVQYQLTKSSLFLWVWPIGTLLLLSIFAISKIGQSKARNQTLRLSSFILHALEQKWQIERF